MYHRRNFLIINTASSVILSAIFCALILFFPTRLQAKEKKSDWIEVRSPHFIVDSNSGKTAAKLIALRLEMIRETMGSVFQGKKPSQSAPLTVLAVAGAPSLRQLLPENLKRSSSTIGGFFTDTMIGPYIVIRTDIVDRDSYGPVFHEYTHYVMRRAIPDLPLWMVEGLADFYANTYVRGHDVLIGLADIYDIDALHEHTLIPVQALLKVGYDSPYYHDPNKVYTFYAESWALVHYLMFQDARHGTHLLPKYAQEVAQGGDPLETFVKIFGSTKHMDNILTPYISRITFTALRYPITEKLSSKSYAVRSLSVVEADSDQAEFLLAENERMSAAKLLGKALKEDPQSAQANALMSFLQLREGEISKAADLAKKAIQLDPEDYRGYFYAALAIQCDHLSTDHTSEVERDLMRTLALKPDLPVANDLLAELEMKQPGKLNQALAWATRAVQAEPENNDYLVDLEMVLLRQDHLAEAVAVEMRMLGRAGTPKKQAVVRNEIGWQLLQQNFAIHRADFEIKKANQLDPKNADIIDSLGHLLEKEGDLPHAAEAYQHALAIQPKEVSSLRGLGDVLRKEHHLGQAIAQYHKALVVNPKNALVHYDLSLALKEKGDAAGAATELKTAHGLDPFNTMYQ